MDWVLWSGMVCANRRVGGLAHELLDSSDATVVEAHFHPSWVVVAGEQLRNGALDLATGSLIGFEDNRD